MVLVHAAAGGRLVRGAVGAGARRHRDRLTRCASAASQRWGSQYTLLAFTAAADVAGTAAVLGSTGDAFDNAAMETVWSTIKREIALIRGSLVFDTRDQAKLYMFDYIEVLYNRQRHQTRLGHQTPVEFAGGFTP